MASVVMVVPLAAAVAFLSMAAVIVLGIGRRPGSGADYPGKT